MNTILIVEDNPAELLMMKKGLEGYSSQFKVLTATNGEEAVKKLKDFRISALVTDLYMPEMDGIELLGHMQREYPQIPCIVASSFISRELLNVLEDKLYSYIEKPVEMKQLVAVIVDAVFHFEAGIALNDLTAKHALQHLESKGISCALEVVSSDTGKGSFYIIDGVLYDAQCENLSAEKAAIEMLLWVSVSLRIKKISLNNITKRIGFNLQTLIGLAEQKKW